MAYSGIDFSSYANGTVFPLAGSFFAAGNVTAGQSVAVSGGDLVFTNSSPGTVAYLDHPNGSLSQISVTFDIVMPEGPTAGEQRLFAIESTAGADVFRYERHSNGRLLARGSDGLTIGTMSTPSSPLVPAGTRLLIELYLGNGALGAGRGKVRITRRDTNAIVTDSGLLTNLTIGDNVQFNVLQIGFVLTSQATMPKIAYGSVAVETAPASAGTYAPETVVNSGPEAPTINVASSGPYMLYDARSSLPGPQDTLTYSIVQTSGPTTNHIEIANGYYLLPQAVSATVYRITATGSPSNLSSTSDVTVPAAATGTALGIRRRRWDGSQLV